MSLLHEEGGAQRKAVIALLCFELRRKLVKEEVIYFANRTCPYIEASESV